MKVKVESKWIHIISRPNPAPPPPATVINQWNENRNEGKSKIKVDRIKNVYHISSGIVKISIQDQIEKEKEDNFFHFILFFFHFVFTLIGSTSFFHFMPIYISNCTVYISKVKYLRLLFHWLLIIFIFFVFILLLFWMSTNLEKKKRQREKQQNLKRNQDESQIKINKEIFLLPMLLHILK